MEYRRKVRNVEAVQVQKGMDESGPSWFKDALASGVVTATGLGEFTRNEPLLSVRQTNGISLPVRRGEWLIRGSEDDLYPCSDAVFRVNYEPVEVEVPEAKEAKSTGRKTAKVVKAEEVVVQPVAVAEPAVPVVAEQVAEPVVVADVGFVFVGGGE